MRELGVRAIMPSCWFICCLLCILPECNLPSAASAVVAFVSLPPFKHGSFLWRGRRFLRRAAPLTLLRARPTWRGEAASPLLLARSFLPRVQWAPCGPTPSLFRAVYLFNVGFYSRRERNGENNNSQKIGYSRLSPSTTSVDEGSGLRDGNVPLQKHRVRFFCECKCTCYLEPVARLPTSDFRGIYVRVFLYGHIHRPYVGYKTESDSGGCFFTCNNKRGYTSRDYHVLVTFFFSLNSGIFVIAFL